jgi:serine/threonine-protein kinase
VLAPKFERDRVRQRLECAMTGTETAPLRLGRYRVGSVIGRGSMGVVYRAHDEVLDRPVALKVADHDVDETAGWLAEARALASVHHRNVVAVYDAGRVEDTAYIAMELIEGATLSDWIEGDRPSSSRILTALLEAGRGLAAIHEAGLVHRDIKPANVMVDAGGEARILDLGLSRGLGRPLAPGAHPEFTDPAGTPAYMAPEQRIGMRPTQAADQYAFCMTAIEALSGTRPPRRGWARAQLRWLKPILARGLHDDPSRRHPSMSALIHRFERRYRWLQMSSLGLAAAAGAAAFAWAGT